MEGDCEKRHEIIEDGNMSERYANRHRETALNGGKCEEILK